MSKRLFGTILGMVSHAVYSLSGKHSDFYFNSDVITDKISELSIELFDRTNKKLSVTPDWVVSYPPFGIELGNALAALYQCKFA